MSCSSIKNRFEQMRANGNISFNEAMCLYNELKGSLDAHKLELGELTQQGDTNSISHLQQHINDGEKLLSSFQNMTIQ